MFIISNWILGFSLSKLATSAIEKSQHKDFSDKLDSVVDKWSKELPENYFINPNSIFPHFDDNNEYLSILKQKFIIKELPSKLDWFNAIFKQWELIKNKYGEGTQDFYKLESDKAKKHINVLSENLHLICQLENDFFRVKVLSELEKIKNQIDEISRENKESPISSKLKNINKIKKSLKILNVFWPLNPMLTKDQKSYSTLHQIAEKAILEIHNSYYVVNNYSEKYEISDLVKKTKNSLISNLNQYLEFVDLFFQNKITKDIDPYDMAIISRNMSKSINSWERILIIIKEKLKIELEDE